MRTRSIGVLAAFKCALRTFRGYRGGRSTPYSRMLCALIKSVYTFAKVSKAWLLRPPSMGGIHNDIAANNPYILTYHKVRT